MIYKDWSWDDVFQNGRVDGEIVTFSVSITNTGNVTVENFVFTETFTDLRDTQPPDLSGELSPLTTTSPEIILPGETIVYTNTYEMSQISVDKGGVSNSVLVEAYGTFKLISDVSDDDETRRYRR